MYGVSTNFSNFVQISYKFRTNFVQISYKFRTNFVQISYKFRTNYDYNLLRVSSMEIGKKIQWYKNSNWILPKDESIWDKTYDDSNFPVNKWFCGGMTNASFNELDQHLYSNNGDKILFIDDKESITIRNFHSLVIFCSRHLKLLNLKKGDRVLIKLPNSINSAAWITACKRNAIIYSCVVFEAPSQIIESRYQDLQAKLIIDDSFPIPSIENVNNEFTKLPDYEYINKINEIEPIEIVESNFPLFVAYTSGSTGKSKGITHTHGGYTAGIKATMDYVFNIKPDDIVFTIGSFGWITGQSYICYPDQCKLELPHY